MGDKESPEAQIFDGTCYQCKTGRMHICQNVQGLGVDRDSVFAQTIVVPERNVWKNGPQLDPEIASMQDPLGNAIHAILPKDRVEDIVGKNVAVLGCGPIGLMAIAVLTQLNASKIFATAGGSNQIRMELANKMGADMVLSAEKDGENLVQHVKDALKAMVLTLRWKYLETLKLLGKHLKLLLREAGSRCSAL